MPKWRDLITTHYPPATVFKQKPISSDDVFEFARSRAAHVLGIHPKHLSLTGSARLGYSLRRDKFGDAFDPLKSDIDLFAIDQTLFQNLCGDFEKFITDWDNKSIKPSVEEQNYWQANKKVAPGNIQDGFLDYWRIPLRKQYSTVSKISVALARFEANLKEQVGRTIGRKTSLRVFRDWNSAVARIAFNIERAI